MKVNSHGPKNTFQKDMQAQPLLLRELKGHLWSIDSSISPSLIDLLNSSSGLQQRVILLLREGITRNPRNPSLINYLYIIDYMLSMPAFNLVLHHYLAQYFCDLFKHLLSQQNFEGIEKMKVFRKYWISKIDYRLYRDLEQMIYQCFMIDIEWIQENALHDLQKFYLEQLHMSLEDVACQLPQLRRQIEEPSRVIYTINKAKKDDDKGKTKETKGENKNPNLQKVKCTQKHTEEHKENSTKRIDQHQTRKNHQLPGELQPLSLKRKREQSEETTISLNMMGNKKMKYSLQTTLDPSTSDQVIFIDPKTPLVPKSNKKKAQSEWRVEERGAMKGFNFLICHVCLQCGIKFQLEKELVAHKESHQRPQCNSPEGQAKENHDDSILVKEEEAHLYTRTCNVCDREIDVDYANGDWKFNKAVKITKYEITFIIHADCLKDVIPQVIDNLEQDSTGEEQ